MKKSWFAVAAVSGLAAMAAAPLGVSPAKAQELGQVSVTGNNVTTVCDPSPPGCGTTHTITFTNPATVGTVSGNLAGVWPSGYNLIGFPTPGVARDWTNASIWQNQVLLGSGPEDFIITTYNFAVEGDTLDLMGTGRFSGAVATPGTWTLTTQLDPFGGSTTTTLSAQAVSVPGPIVGAGLPGLIAALGGLVAIARRRRKQLA